MTHQEQIAMLVKALAPFADLLEDAENAPEMMELFIESSDVLAAQKALAAVKDK